MLYINVQFLCDSAGANERCNTVVWGEGGVVVKGDYKCA